MMSIKSKLVNVIGTSEHNLLNSEFLYSFVIRRSNFHGLNMKGRVLPQKGLLKYNDNYKQEAKYFPENQTYTMNSFVSGLIIDLWSILEEQLNFTTHLFHDYGYRYSRLRIRPFKNTPI